MTREQKVHLNRRTTASTTANSRRRVAAAPKIDRAKGAPKPTSKVPARRPVSTATAPASPCEAKHSRFDIRYMRTGQRYAFLGIVIVFVVLLFFFAGLAVDYLLMQEATCAIWGIWLGAFVAILFTWCQLAKLAGKPNSLEPNPHHHDKRVGSRKAKTAGSSSSKSSQVANDTMKLSAEELRILTEARLSEQGGQGDSSDKSKAA